MSVWIPAAADDDMRREAQRHAPAETGGVLVGYRTDESFVVTAMVDGGPLAMRSPEGFWPDAAYQAERVAELYEASGRLDTYLGDWHSHPGGHLSLSPTDRRTIRRISRHSDARCRVPLMLVVGGRGENRESHWEVAGWVFDPARHPRLAALSVHVHHPSTPGNGPGLRRRPGEQNG